MRPQRSPEPQPDGVVRPAGPHVGTPDGDGVPLGLRAAAGWTWRLLLIGLALYFLLRLLSMFEVVVVPVLVALLVVAFLRPLVDLVAEQPARFDRPGRPGLPRGLASFLAIVIALAVIGGLFTLIGQQITTGFPDLQRQAQGGWTELQRQLQNSPLHVSSESITNLVNRSTEQLRANSGRLVSGAVQVGSTAADIGTGFFIVLFSTFFFLSGGEQIWSWVVQMFPRSARPRVNGAGVRAWATLTAYVRATVIVAFVDGLGVAVVAAILGVPLAIPLGVLVFLGAFVPVVGALVTGIVAVLVALVAQGPIVAALMLAGVIAVQQVEAHVLQPFLMGHAVSVHPLGVILSIGAGVLLAGIVGGLFAVPLAAVANVVGKYLASDEAAPGDAPGEADPRLDAQRAAREAGPLADDVGDAAEDVARRDEADDAAARAGRPTTG